jgi:glutamate formiminotransferase
MGLESVVNVSEGRDRTALDRLAETAGDVLLDRHSDPDHHRAVFTLAGPDEAVERAVRQLAAAAVDTFDLGGHDGRHPRMGVVDVVPFVPLRWLDAPAVGSAVAGDGPRLDPTAPLGPAVAARDRFARWAWRELALPCFLYGPLPGGGERALPDVRHQGFRGLAPDVGAGGPHPSAGACAVGARGFLVAYNLWLGGADLEMARQAAKELRGPGVRALGLELSGRIQVSCNLIDPVAHGPAEVTDRLRELLIGTAATVERCELVGLVPAAVLDAVPEGRWAELGLDPAATIERRLAAKGTSWR